MRQRIMSVIFVAAVILFASLSSGWAIITGCWVEDGTFYAKKKSSMTAFAIYVDQRKKADALRMVDDGRIGSCRQASAVVIERDGPLVFVQIVGIGKVWIYETYLHCK